MMTNFKLNGKFSFSTVNSRAFSLIELMIVIAIIGILVAVAIPQFNDMIKDTQLTKAKQDCDTFVQAIQKFNSLEGTTVQDKYMKELKGKYISTLETLKDPWGNRYEQDYRKGIVYSKGPDGKHKDGPSSLPENKDDVFITYIGALSLVSAKIEVNPLGGNFLDPIETEKCYDVLHLYFNKEVQIPVGGVNLKAAATANATSTTSDPLATAESIFRYYNTPSPRSAPITPGGDDLNDLPEIPASDIAWGSDSKEIILKMPAGYTSADPARKLLIPGTHYMNLTGAKNNKNHKFMEVASTSAAIDGAEASGSQILIKNYE
jgi:prepilin-type N-terminal cleavage/methylation domain-containing protein